MLTWCRNRLGGYEVGFYCLKVKKIFIYYKTKKIYMYLFILEYVSEYLFCIYTYFIILKKNLYLF